MNVPGTYEYLEPPWFDLKNYPPFAREKKRGGLKSRPFKMPSTRLLRQRRQKWTTRPAEMRVQLV